MFVKHANSELQVKPFTILALIYGDLLCGTIFVDYWEKI